MNPEPRPPRWAVRLLRWAVGTDAWRSTVLEDLDQEFREIATARSGSAARRWYAAEAVKLASHFIWERARPGGRGEGGGTMEGLGQHVGFAIRRLRRAPGFALVAVLTMALGIGATVAIFSVVDAVLLEPLPYRSADRLVALWEWNTVRDNRTNVANPGNFRDWRDRSATFEAMSAVSMTTPVTIHTAGESEEVMARFAHPDFFDVLGLEAAVGRTFAGDIDREGTESVISYRYWQRRFGGDPSILGETVQVNTTTTTLVGVMPPEYVVFGEDTDVWAGIDLTRGDQTNTGRWLNVVGRLADGATIEAARSELEAISAALREEFPDLNAGWSVNLVPLKEQVVGDVSQALWLLLGAVGLLLTIACANVANLFLVHATERQQEMAVRTAMGARGRTLAAQLLVESLIVAGVGAAVGVGLAHLGTTAIATRMPDVFALPRVESAGVDGTVLLFAVGITVLTGVLFGLVPALQAASTRPAATLNAEGRGSSRRTGALRNGLVITEVALSMVLLAGAALLGRSLTTLLAVDPGIEPEQVLVGRVNLSAGEYDDDAAKVAFFEELLDALAAKPGVEAVGGITFLPMDGMGAATSFWPGDRAEPAADQRPAADIRNVAGDYFETMGIRLLEGRVFDRRDGPDAPQTVVVNRALAEEYWPNESAVGKPVVVNWVDHEPWEIVGVVEDVRVVGLDQEARAAIYHHYPRAPFFDWLQITIGARGDPAPLAAVLRDEVRALDPAIAVGNVRPMEGIVAASTGRSRMISFLTALFAGIATLLAAVGLYGLLAYAITARVREIGVRVAIGAAPGHVLRMVVGQGTRLAIAGLAVGLAASWGVGRAMASLLYQVSPTDPLALSAAAMVLFLAAVAACAVPAWRAARLDPATALRSE